MPYTKSQVNTNLARYNSNTGTWEARYSLPEIKVVGTPRILPKRERPYWVSARTTLLQPSELMAPLGLVGQAIENIDYAHPVTAAASYVFNDGKPIIGPAFNEYVAPTLALGNYAAALTDGSINPYHGAELRSLNENLMGAFLPLDFIGIGKAPKAIKNVGKGVADVAARTGENIYNSIPVSVVDDALSKITNGGEKTALPSYWRVYYDKFAPKTRRIISHPYITTNKGHYYRLLTPRSKLWRDRLFDTDEYLLARAEGQYPLNRAEGRLYIMDINNDYLGVRDRLINRRTNDYGVRDHYRWEESPEEYKRGLEWAMPRRIHFLSEEGNKYSSQRWINGFLDNFDINLVSRRRNSLLPQQSRSGFRGTLAHEADHVILTNLDEYLNDTSTKPKGKYWVLNLDNKNYKSFAPLEENRGQWEGAPFELMSEVLKSLESFGTTKSYRDLPLSLKFVINADIGDRFGIKEPLFILSELSNLGYFEKGGQIAGTKLGNFLNSDVVKFAGIGQLYDGISGAINLLKMNDRLLLWKKAYVDSTPIEDFSLQVEAEEELLKQANPDYNSSPIVKAYRLNMLLSLALAAAKLKADLEADLMILLLQQLNDSTLEIGNILTLGLGLVGEYLNKKKVPLLKTSLKLSVSNMTPQEFFNIGK